MRKSESEPESDKEAVGAREVMSLGGSQGDLPNPRIEPVSPASPALAGGFFTAEPPGKP